MTLLGIYALFALIVLGFMTALWLISLALRNASIVDAFWGTGIVVAGWVYFLLTPHSFRGRGWLICILVTGWGLRLSFYILWRSWSKGEDFPGNRLFPLPCIWGRGWGRVILPPAPRRIWCVKSDKLSPNPH